MSSVGKDPAVLPHPGPGVTLTFLLLRTRTRSQPRTVVTRWAMTSTVQPQKASRIVCWMSLSVSMSMEAVASSMMMICRTQSGVKAASLGPETWPGPGSASDSQSP